MTHLRALALRAFGLALLLALAAQVQAQDGGLTWEPLPGPYGGWATALASAPDDGGVVAIASDWDHLYRSNDGGAWWERLDLDRGGFSSLFAAPGGDFWAPGTPLLRSTDGGIMWTEAGLGLPGGGATALGGAPDGTLYAATGSGLYRRTPSSSIWVPTGFTDPALTVAVSPSGTVLTSTDEPIDYDWFVVHRSTDSGATWEPVVLLPEEYATVRAITFLDDGTALAGGVTEPKGYATPGLFRSADGGLTWAALPDYPEVQTRAFYPGPDVVYADTYDGSLRSTDAGQSWAPAERRVGGVAAGPGGSVLLATAGLGILRSDDGGETWHDATDGFGRAEVGHVTVGGGGHVYAASPADYDYGSGLHRSFDGGATWDRVDLPFTTLGAHDLHLDPEGVLFLAPEQCNGCSGAGLYRSSDEGTSWEDVTPLTAEGWRNTIVHIADGPDGVLWASAGFRLYRSADGGLTWEERAPAGARSFTVGPDGTLWSGTGQTSGSRVYRSTDDAASWETVFDPPVVRIGAIAATPSGVVIVSAFMTDYRSTDFGATWESVDLNLGQSYHEVDVFVRTQDGVLFGGVDGPPAVIRSLDDGATWEPAAEGLPTGSYYYSDLALDDEGHLWSANGRPGLFRTTQSVTVAAEPPPLQPEGLAIAVYPNPFEQRTSVVLVSEKPHRHVEAEVLDVLGRRVAILHAGPISGGRHILRLDGSALSAGAYFVRVASDAGVAVSRIALTR